MMRIVALLLQSKTLAFVVFLTLVLPFEGMAQKKEKLSPSSEQIDKIFTEWNDADKAGIAVGIVSDGKIVYKKGYGSANLEHNVPISSKTKFPIANIADQFIALSAMLLQEEGKLSLDDDIRRHLPEIRKFAQPIRIKHLLYHTSGLNPLSTLKEIAGWRAGDAFSQAQAFELINSQKALRQAPGEAYLYDPSGMMLLEEIIARVSGQAYPDFVQARIFKPLGMTESVYDKDGSLVLENRAMGYNLGATAYAGAKLSYAADGPSILFSTVDDLCKWLLNYRQLKVGTAAMFQALDAAALVKDKPVKPVNRALRMGQYRLWDFKGTEKLYIIGMTAGYAGKIIRFPDLDFSVIVLGNESSYNGYTSSSVADLYLEKYYTSAPPSSDNSMKHISMSKEKLELYCGSYWNPEGFYARKIYLKNDTLRYLREENGYESNLFPIGDGLFQMQSWAKITVEFKGGKSNKTMTVIVNDEAPEISQEYQPKAAWTNDLSIFQGEFYAEALGTSYTIEQEGPQLMIQHQRMEAFPLYPMKQNSFRTNKAFFNSIEFEFGENNRVKGFWLSSFGIDKIWFESLSAKNIERVK